MKFPPLPCLYGLREKDKKVEISARVIYNADDDDDISLNFVHYKFISCLLFDTAKKKKKKKKKESKRRRKSFKWQDSKCKLERAKLKLFASRKSLFIFHYTKNNKRALQTDDDKVDSTLSHKQASNSFRLSCNFLEKLFSSSFSFFSCKFLTIFSHSSANFIINIEFMWWDPFSQSLSSHPPPHSTA